MLGFEVATQTRNCGVICNTDVQKRILGLKRRKLVQMGPTPRSKECAASAANGSSGVLIRRTGIGDT